MLWYKLQERLCCFLWLEFVFLFAFLCGVEGRENWFKVVCKGKKKCHGERFGYECREF